MEASISSKWDHEVLTILRSCGICWDCIGSPLACARDVHGLLSALYPAFPSDRLTLLTGIFIPLPFDNLSYIITFVVGHEHYFIKS